MFVILVNVIVLEANYNKQMLRGYESCIFFYKISLLLSLKLMTGPWQMLLYTADPEEAPKA